MDKTGFISMNNNTAKSHKNGNSDPNKKHLLSDPSFDALVELQKEIAEQTGWLPSLYKLINTLINTDTLPYLKELILAEWHHRQRPPLKPSTTDTTKTIT
jgi:hypothetical protein